MEQERPNGLLSGSLGTDSATSTILLEKRIPVDLLPDREAETFAAWLMAHPGVEIISRDRGGDYAKGAKAGAPNALQTADRWHLLKNLSETMQSFFLRKQPQLKAAMGEAAGEAEDVPLLPMDWRAGRSQHQKATGEARHQERLERYHQIHDLYAKKVDPSNIARQVGVSRQCVYEYLRMQHPPERTRIEPGRQPLTDAYKDHLIRRWNQGCRNAQLLYREIKAAGYTGSDTAVSRFIAPLRATYGKARSFKSVEPTPQTRVKLEAVKKQRPPTTLQVAHWIIFKEEQRLDWQKAYLARLGLADQEIAHMYELIQGFTTMLRERQGEQFDEWLKVVKEQGVPELQSFAQGLERDYDAVKAGLTLKWSQGPVEGHVHRLKLIKRQSYGRASFDHLRKRVLRCS